MGSRVVKRTSCHEEKTILYVRMIVEYASCPKWADEVHKRIDMTVKFSHINHDVEFTATVDDNEKHGRELFERAIVGEFGDIADYVPPPPPTPPSTEELATRARSERDRLLALTDWTQAADIPQSTKDKWVPYRQALRDVPAQEDFPIIILWPQAP